MERKSKILAYKELISYRNLVKRCFSVKAQRYFAIFHFFTIEIVLSLNYITIEETKILLHTLMKVKKK